MQCLVDGTFWVVEGSIQCDPASWDLPILTQKEVHSNRQSTGKHCWPPLFAFFITKCSTMALPMYRQSDKYYQEASAIRPPLVPYLYILIYPHPPNARVYSKKYCMLACWEFLPPACKTDMHVYIVRISEAYFQLWRTYTVKLRTWLWTQGDTYVWY